MDKKKPFIVEKAAMEKACAILSQEEGLPPFQAPLFTEGTPEEYFNKAGVSFRTIELKNQWWKQANGSILGFTKEGGRPVALIDTKAYNYQFINGLGEEKPVDLTVHQSLLPEGYILMPNPEKPMTGFFRIFTFCSKNVLKEFKMVFLTGAFSALVTVFFPFANQVIFDHVLSNFNLSLFVQILIGMLLATVASSLFSLFRSLYLLRIDGIVGNRLQGFIWEKILRLPLSFFRSLPIGDLLQRTMIVDEMRKKFNDTAISVVFNAIFSLLYLAVMMFFSFKLTVIILQLVLVTSLLTLLIAFLRIKYLRKELAVEAKINGFLVQVISGISKLRVAEAIKRVFSLWAEDFKVSQQVQYQAQTLQNILTTWISVTGIAIPLLIFGGVAYILHTGGTLPLTLGSFLGFYTAMNLFISAVLEMASQLSLFAQLVPYWDRASLIFKTPDENEARLPAFRDFSGQIKVQNLFFRYNASSPYIFEDVSIDIPKGSWIGLVGPSGVGKSTFCKLLVGLEKPEKGQIRFDGKDLSGVSLSSLREQMAVLLQSSSSIFSGSLYENLCCGRDLTTDEIMTVAKQTEFLQDLEELPMGLNTLLPAGGAILSGGQRQRLLLTRALLRKPKILILDEAINSLDFPSQKLILDRIKKMEMTKIVISHSPQLKAYADKAYLFSKGKIKPLGN